MTTLKSLMAAPAILMSALLLAVTNGRSGVEDAPPARPSAVWLSGPLEVVAAFADPLPPAKAKALVGRTINYLPPAPAGTKLVGAVAPGSLRIAGARLADGGRTLVLATDPHPSICRYALSPGKGPDRSPVFEYDLHGVEASWYDEQAAAGEPTWKGWLPSLDVRDVDRLAPQSAPHERLKGLLGRPGKLTLSALVALPPGDRSVRIESSRPVSEVSLGDAAADQADPEKAGPGPVDLAVGSRGEHQFFSATVSTGGDRPPNFRVLQRGPGEEAFQPIAADKHLLPWAPTPQPSAEPAPAEVPDLAGGDAKRGEALFFGDQARCGQCHAFRGRGAAIGPDLTEIGRKGSEYAYRSIAAPSAEISPEFLPYTVAARDGRVFAGLVHAEGPDAIKIIDNAAKSTTLRRDEIEQIRPSGTSIMPVGLAGALGDQGLRDLFAYLMQAQAR